MNMNNFPSTFRIDQLSILFDYGIILDNLEEYQILDDIKSRVVSADDIQDSDILDFFRDKDARISFFTPFISYQKIISGLRLLGLAIPDEVVNLNNVSAILPISFIVLEGQNWDIIGKSNPDLIVLLHIIESGTIMTFHYNSKLSDKDESLVGSMLDPQQDNEIFNLPPQPSLQVFYSFLLDSNLMHIRDAQSALESFFIAHNQMLSTLLDYNSQSFILPHPFLKAYYKFRHNIFGALCKLVMGNKNFALGTDVPLKKYLVNSSKTPDFIVENDNEIAIYEFTVGNKYDTIDFHKGGGNYNLKYSTECFEIQKLTGKKCFVKIVPAVLNNYNIEEIFNILEVDVLIRKDYFQSFEHFFDTCNLKKDIISSNNTLSFHAITTADIEELDGFKHYDRPPDLKIMMVKMEVCSSVSKSFQYLRERLSTLVDKDVLLNLYMDISNFKITLRIEKKGRITPVQLVEVVNQNSISGLISILILVENGNKVSFEKIRGSVPISVPNNVKHSHATHEWTYQSVSNSLYSCDTPLYHDEWIELYDLNDIVLHKSNEILRVVFPPNYFESLCNMDFQPLMDSTTKKILANCRFSNDDITNSVEDYNSSMLLQNNINYTFSPKPTFMSPFPTIPLKFAALDSFDDVLLSTYLKSGVGKYTAMIVNSIKSKRFCTVRKLELNDEISKARESVSSANRSLFEKRKELNLLKPMKLLTSNERLKLLQERSNLDKVNRVYRTLLGGAKGVLHERMIRIPCGKKSTNYKLFKAEMNHFTKVGNGYRGVGWQEDYIWEDFDLYLKDLTKRLLLADFQQNGFRSLFGENSNMGPEFLTKLKDMHHQRFNQFFTTIFRGTLLEQICYFTANLAENLFNESVKTYNKDYVKVDNLGFSDTILIVRGGAKIYKNQSSKLFKLLFKVQNKDSHFMGYEQNNFFEKFKGTDSTIIVTPWSQLRQDVLFDMMSMPQRTFMNLFSSYTRIYPNLQDPVPDLLLFPTLLALHNRRKTEKFMHNSRYLIVNPLGNFANIGGILESFADFNQTYLDGWLRYRLGKSYSQFASVISRVKSIPRQDVDNLIDQSALRDLWFDQPIANSDHLTNFIYITYMMTKSSVNSSLEQASNLWEILEDVLEYDKKHSDVVGMADESHHINVLNFTEQSYEDDFVYDPVYCQYLGHYISGYLKNMTGTVELANLWENLSKQDIDRLANSNGLRGWNKDNFFNKKGYEVVYEWVNQHLDDKEILNRIEGYLEDDYISSTNSINTDKINDLKLNELLFHIVHKLQRGGGREIFCMDLFTKAKQNPIEKFFKKLCKHIPNEFISIPSGKRTSIIHTDFYEKGPGPWVNKIYRWVLDCRRWAPHSVFQKYVHFVRGMGGLLPGSFMKDFFDFAEKMFTKKFITREHVLSKLRNNKKYENYKGLFSKIDKFVDGYEMTVKFSFVMGIFNYLSTLMHAANQLVASEVIRNVNLRLNQGLVILDPKCHSDDSVVSSYHESDASARLTFLIYDWHLKCSNHMLSVKKSQINDNIYLEFLSTLYLFDRLLPVLPKFASTIPFKPSDMGYSSDMSFAITQGIEMLSQGGSFEECYLIVKLTESFVKGVYKMPTLKGLPYNFLGGIDSHPIEFLYAGGLSDLARFYYYDRNNFWRIFNLMTKLELMNPDDPNISLSWDMGARRSNSLLKKFKLQDINDKLLEVAPWTINNCKLGNSTLNLIWFYNKLKDPKFYSSLIDEPVARRYSRIFGAINYRNLRSKSGTLIPINKVLFAIFNREDLENVTPNVVFEKYIQNMCRDLFEFYNSIEGTEIIDTQRSSYKDKPMQFRRGVSSLGNVSISADQFVAYVKEPLGFKLLGLTGNPIREVNKITKHLEVLSINPSEYDPAQLYQLTRKYISGEYNNYRIIAPVPGDKRICDSYSETIELVANNSMRYKRLVIKNTTAHFIDWQRKVLMGQIPKQVVHYLKSFWAYQFVKKFNVDEMDIFIKNPLTSMNQLADELPRDWKPVISHQEKQLNTKVILRDIYFWCHWTKEQLKIGNRWFGSGECIINVPEVVLKLIVTNGVITEILFEGEFQGELSLPSSWYLHHYFNLSGLHTEMISSEFADPSTIYLGYSRRNSTFGVGRSKAYDEILPLSKKGFNLLPNFTYRELTLRSSGRTFIYSDFDSNIYKIDFFLPSDSPVILDLKEYIDVDKIKNNIANHNVKNFTYELSIQIYGTVKLDKQDLIDNLGASLIYHVFYNNQKNHELAHENDSAIDKTNDYLLESLFNWKKLNLDFGMPSLETLESFLGQRDVPPLPRKVYNMMVTLGKTDMKSDDFSSLLYQVLALPTDEREMFLLNSFPQLSTSSQLTGLVLMKRNTRIFDCCKNLSANAVSIAVQLCLLLSNAIKKHNVYSPTLYSLKRNLELSTKTGFETNVIFEILYTRLLMDGINSNVRLSSDDHAQEFVMTIIEELWNSGLAIALNHVSTSDPLFQSVEFNVEWEQFKNWVVDILDCVFSVDNKRRLTPEDRRTLPAAYLALFRKPTWQLKSRDLYGENGLISVPMGQLRKYAIKMRQCTLENEITLVKKVRLHPKSNTFKSVLEVIKRVDAHAGFTDEEFFPLSEDTQIEYDMGYMYGEDGKEDAEIDKNRKIPLHGFSNVICADKMGITSARGSAWNMFIGCNYFSNEIGTLVGKITVFKKKQITNSVYSYMESSSNYLIYIGKQKCREEVLGYEKLTWERAVIFGRESRYQNKSIEIEGKKYDKKAVYRNPRLAGKLDTIDNYFSKVQNIDMISEQLETEVKLLDTIAEYLPTNDKFWEVHGQFEKYLSDVTQMRESSKNVEDTSATQKTLKMYKRLKAKTKKQRQSRRMELTESELKEVTALSEETETKESQEYPAITEEEFFQQIGTAIEQMKTQDSYNELVNWSESTGARVQVEQELSYYKFAEPLKLVHDQQFLSQFETLFPNSWDSILKNEIGISEQVRRTRIRLAELQIKSMPPLLRRKYNKLYFIVKSLLYSLPTVLRMNGSSMEFALEIDNLFDIELEGQEEFEIFGSDLTVDNREDIGRIDWSLLE